MAPPPMITHCALLRMGGLRFLRLPAGIWSSGSDRVFH